MIQVSDVFFALARYLMPYAESRTGVITYWMMFPRGNNYNKSPQVI